MRTTQIINLYCWFETEKYMNHHHSDGLCLFFILFSWRLYLKSKSRLVKSVTVTFSSSIFPQMMGEYLWEHWLMGEWTSSCSRYFGVEIGEGPSPIEGFRIHSTVFARPDRRTQKACLRRYRRRLVNFRVPGKTEKHMVKHGKTRHVKPAPACSSHHHGLFVGTTYWDGLPWLPWLTKVRPPKRFSQWSSAMRPGRTWGFQQDQRGGQEQIPGLVNIQKTMERFERSTIFNG